MEVWISIIAIIFSNMTFIVIVAAWWRTRQRKLELQAEVQSKLIEKFGSTPELVEFLQSPAGREFVNGVQRGAASTTRERILAGIRRSVILTFLGLAFGGIWIVTDREAFSFPTIILLALGVGHIVAIFVSLSMSRRLGLAEEPARHL